MKNGKNAPHLEITKLVLVHCNIVNNDYQHDSRVLHACFPNILPCQLLNSSPKNVILLKLLVQSFHILKHGLLIKILNRQR